MRASHIAARVGALGVLTALLTFSGITAAQSYRPESFERPEAAPALNLSLSFAMVQTLNSEADYDIRSFDFARGKRGIDRIGSGRSSERVEGWRFYGRVYLLNFQNELGRTPLMGTEVTFRRTGPSLTGRIYFGFSKRF